MMDTLRTDRPQDRAPTRRRPARHAFRPRLDHLDDRVMMTVYGGAAVAGSPFPVSVVEFALEPSVAAGNDVQYASPSYDLIDDSGSTADPLGSAGPVGLRPSQVARAYGFDQIALPGGIRGDGTGQTIVILNAFDNPNIVNDLAQFNRAFGLPDPPSFTIYKQTVGGRPPAPNSGWALEIALDVQWAHAMAPGADIILAEAYDNTYANLMGTARYMAALDGVSVMSMSFGSDEFSGQTSYESTFVTPAGHQGVTFLAASGDTGVISFPASSARVVGVGGTTLSVDASGTYLGETGWGGSGGGTSRFVARPGYQDAVVAGNFRQSPDVAYDANPATGFAVYDSYNNGGDAFPWVQIGGTSASAPQWASLIAIANQARALNGLPSLDGFSQTLPMLYQLPSSSYRDVVSGSAGGKSARAGYDLVTGLGTPLADRVVAGLAGTPATSTSPAVGDAGFEAVSVGSGGGAYAYIPAGSPWSFAGNAGLSGNGSAFTSGNPAAPGGSQVAFLQGAGSSISQAVGGWSAGRYVVTFRAAQRGNYGAQAQDFRVLVDGQEVGVFRPGSASYEAFRTASFDVPAGAHAVAFEAINGGGGDNTAFLDDVAVVEATSSVSSPSVGDAGFEAVPVGSGGDAYAYTPAGSPWSFAGGAGLSGNGSAFTSGNPAAPGGSQVAFLQGAGSSISQAVGGWSAGRYVVTFRAAQRGNYGAQAQDFRVLVDGQEVGVFRPGSASYEAFRTASFDVPAGAHAVAFEAINGGGGDNTAFLDDVAIVPAAADAGGPAPAASPSWGVLAPSYPFSLDESAPSAPIVARLATKGNRPRPTTWNFR